MSTWRPRTRSAPPAGGAPIRSGPWRRVNGPILVGQLYDGTGSIDLVWWGRRRIAGIKPGTHLMVEGRVADGTHRLQIHNPAYQLLGPGQ